MTTEALKRRLTSKYDKLSKEWPSHLEVDADTYANVCQTIFDNVGSEDNDGANIVKRMTISFGVNNGILFKNIELILTPKVNMKPLLSIDEIKTIYNLLKNQYVNYENTEAIEVLNKMEKLVEGDK